MSTPVVVQTTIGSGYFGHWMHVFQNANTQWLHIFESRIFSGNFFLGLQAQSAHIYDAQIPKGALIISATERVQAFQTSNPTIINVPMNTPDRVSHGTLPLLKPFQTFRGWRPSIWNRTDIDLIDNTAGIIIQTSTGVNNASWIVKQLTAPGGTLANREEIGEIFTMPAVGNTTIGSCVWQMIRTGNPAGSMRIRIEGTISVLGVLEPDGITLTTSDDILASAVPTAPATGSPVTFTFSGGNQISLTVGVNYAIILDTDYSVVPSNFIRVRHQNQFLTIGRQIHLGDGLGMDWQNYPGSVDCNQALLLNSLSTTIVWPMPRFFINQFFTSPDVSAIIQDQVNQPWYTPDSGIILSKNSPLAGAVNRIWRSAISPNMPRLTVTYQVTPKFTIFRRRRRLQTSFPQGA